MAQQFPALLAKHAAFIAEQQVFFVGTAAADGRVNISPKGMDTLRVLAPDHIIWLNLTGSGNETAAHLRRLPRMTLMWCAFDEPPLILRAYGRAEATHPGDARWPALAAHFPAHLGARQVIDLRIDLVQTSCGFGVPLMEQARERPTLALWAERKGDDGIRQYWADRNAQSIDGFDTGIPGAR